MREILKILGRDETLFDKAFIEQTKILKSEIENSRILVVGAAGSIGKAVTKELFALMPKTLHAIDISENNLAELVRQIRSTLGYKTEDFSTFCIDIGSSEFNCFVESEDPYDLIFNLSALKHVRSEKDPYTLMRMIKTNIFNSMKLHDVATKSSTCRYFCVSSDKAANPENLMGATKRIMELFAFQHSTQCHVSMARFANVAFSDGSLLHSFQNRIRELQPISAPFDIQRYFITAQEAAQLCILSGLTANNSEIYFPLAPTELKPICFSDLAIRFLEHEGYEPYLCSDENEARDFFKYNSCNDRRYPCFLFPSDTTGEKALEEFYTDKESVIAGRYENIGVVSPSLKLNPDILEQFTNAIVNLDQSNWIKADLVNAIKTVIPNMNYEDNGLYLDGKM